VPLGVKIVPNNVVDCTKMDGGWVDMESFLKKDKVLSYFTLLNLK